MRIVIAGAGVAGRRLISRLTSGRHDVVVIDLHRDLCEAVSAEYGIAAICGNATDMGLLEEAELERADVAVALLRESADNLAFCLLARGAGVERIIARMPNPKYRAAYDRAGVSSIIDVTSLFLDRLVLEIERPPVHQVASIADGQGGIVWVTVSEGASVCSRPLDHVRADRSFPRGCVVAGLIRADSDRLLFPSGRDRILPGDRVLLVGSVDGLTRAADVFGAKGGIISQFRSARARRDSDSEDVSARLDATAEESDGEDAPG